MTHKTCVNNHLSSAVREQLAKLNIDCGNIEGLKRFEGKSLNIGMLEFGKANNIMLIDEARLYYIALRKFDKLSGHPNNIFNFDDDVLPPQTTGLSADLSPHVKAKSDKWENLFARISAVTQQLRTQILAQLPDWARKIVAETERSENPFFVIEKYRKQFTPSILKPDINIVDANYGTNPLSPVVNFFENFIPATDIKNPMSEALALVKFLKGAKENPDVAIINPKKISGFSSLPTLFQNIVLIPSQNMDNLYTQLDALCIQIENTHIDKLLNESKTSFVIILFVLCFLTSLIIFKNSYALWRLFHNRGENVKAIASMHQIDLDEVIAKRKRINKEDSRPRLGDVTWYWPPSKSKETLTPKELHWLSEWDHEQSSADKYFISSVTSGLIMIAILLSAYYLLEIK